MNTYEDMRPIWHTLSDKEKDCAIMKVKELLRKENPSLSLILEELQNLYYKRGYEAGQNDMMMQEGGAEA